LRGHTLVASRVGEFLKTPRLLIQKKNRTQLRAVLGQRCPAARLTITKRRMMMMRITLVALAGAALLSVGAALAQQNVDFSKVEIKTTDLGNKTYMLEGQGGNITVAVGNDGIIMADSEFAPLQDKIKAAIAKLSPLPIKYLINTHFHGDHTGGNALFHKDGATSWRRIISAIGIAWFLGLGLSCLIRRPRWLRGVPARACLVVGPWAAPEPCRSMSEFADRLRARLEAARRSAERGRGHRYNASSRPHV
jgi:hypothetical protein